MEIFFGQSEVYQHFQVKFISVSYMLDELNLYSKDDNVKQKSYSYSC